MNLISRCCVCASLFVTVSYASVLAQSVTKDVVYTSAGESERGDIYEPAGVGPFPAVIYIHGGSWRSGGKGDFRKLATDLAAQGYAGFSIDYDLRPHSFPASWQQARDAVSFLRSHAAEYHVDPSRIAIAGASAGGELAALVALAPGGPAGSRQTDPQPVNVAAAIILSGVFDLHSSVGVITRYLGATCESAQAVCDDASPLQHVHPGAPPFFVGHGTSDHTVPYASAQMFVAALQKDNVPVTLYSATGGPHMYFMKNNLYADNLKALESFLQQTLQAKR